MIRFNTFEEADAVDAKSLEYHVAEMRKEFPQYNESGNLKRFHGVTEIDGKYLLPDHPYHIQAAGELGIEYEII